MKKALLFCLLLPACRHQHLGETTGRAYKNALTAQTEGRDSQAPAAMDSQDAKIVMMKHHEAMKDKGPGGGDGMPGMVKLEAK